MQKNTSGAYIDESGKSTWDWKQIYEADDNMTDEEYQSRVKPMVDAEVADQMKAYPIPSTVSSNKETGTIQNGLTATYGNISTPQTANAGKGLQGNSFLNNISPLVESAPVGTTSYIENLFDVQEQTDWKKAPPKSAETADEGFINAGIDFAKDIGTVVTSIPSAVKDWGEGFFYNSQEKQGIKDLSKYETEMAKTSSDLERQQVQQDLLKQGVITEDYFNQQQSSIDNKQAESQKYYQQATAGFKDSLTEAVKPYLNQADKMQQKYILAAIDSQVNQYGKQWSAINDSYEGTEFNKASTFSQLNNEIANMIQDTVVQFSEKIMQGKDSQTAYDELLPTKKQDFERIAQFGLDVSGASNLASREHFYGKMTQGVSLDNAWATLGYISSFVQEATQVALTNPIEGFKQEMLGDYDVVEDLQRMGVYSDAASLMDKSIATGSHLWGNVMSGAPQIVPVIAIVAAELVTGNVPALAALTKGSKIRTGLGELAKDTLIYNGMVQTSLGRGMTETDMAQNFIFDGPIDATLGLLEKPIKKELDSTWLKKFGKDYGFTPSNTVSQDVLNLMNSGNKDAAMTLHLANVSEGKMGDITIKSLNTDKQAEIASMQNVIKESVAKMDSESQTLKEAKLIDDAAQTVLQKRSVNDVIAQADLSKKITNEVQVKLSDPNSYLSNKMTFNALSSMVRKQAIGPDEINQTLDVIQRDLSGIRLGTTSNIYRASDTDIANTVSAVRQYFTGETSIPKSAFDSPQKMQLFHVVQNELYKNIAIARSTVPGADIGKYVISDGNTFVDKVTRKEMSQDAFIATLDNVNSMNGLGIEKTRLENIYGELRRTDKFIDYSSLLGATDIVVQNPHLEDFVKKLYNQAIVIKKGQEGFYPAVMAGRIKNIIDGNLNLYQLSTNDLALMRMFMLPGILEKGKNTIGEITSDNAWNLWDKTGKLDTKFANATRVNELVKNVIKDGDASDIVSVTGDIKGIDKNLESISIDGLPNAFSKSIDNIKNDELRQAVDDEFTQYEIDVMNGKIDNGPDLSEGIYPEGSIFNNMSDLEGAQIMHHVIDAVAEDKALAQAVTATEDIIKQDLANGVVKGLVGKNARKFKSLLKDEDTANLKSNIGGSIIGGATIEPFEIKTIEDQIDAIEGIMEAGGITDKAFVNKVVDSIGRIDTGTVGLLSFKKIEELTQAAMGKLISWSKAEVQFKTDTLANVKLDRNTLDDITRGIHLDVKKYIEEIDTIKSSVDDPIEMYKNILRTNYKYRSMIYTYILQGATGSYVDDLYKLIQTAADVRFLSTEVKIDKFMENIKAELLSVEVSDIRSLTYKTYNQISTKEKMLQAGDKVFQYKQAGGNYFIKNGKAPVKISPEDVSLVNTKFTYIVTNDKGVDKMKNPIRVSGLHDSYKFISMNELLTGMYEKGNPIFMPRRFTEALMSSDGDKLKVATKLDIVPIINHILNNPDVKTLDLDVYSFGKELVIQPDDLNKANALFKIRTLESDIVYDNAMKTFMNGFSTETISGYKQLSTEEIAKGQISYNDILNENKRTLEYIAGVDRKIPTDIKIASFFEKFGVTEKSLIPVPAVVDKMFNELYQFGSLYRTILRATLQNTKPNKQVPLKNIAVSYKLGKEYTEFLNKLPSNPDLIVSDMNIHKFFNALLEANEGDITESATALYSIMIREGMPLKDIREGMTSLFQIYGFQRTLPEYIHNLIFPTVDIFRAQQVADAVISSVAGKKKEALIDSFNSKIKGQLEIYNHSHFGTDTHMIKLLENIQQMGYIQPDINIYKVALLLGEYGTSLKRMLKQIYNGDMIRLIDDVGAQAIDNEERIAKQYKGIQAIISKVIDRANLGDKLKFPVKETENVQTLSIDEEELLLHNIQKGSNQERILDDNLKDFNDAYNQETSFLTGSSISTKQEIDVSGIIINFKQSIDELTNQSVEMLSLKGNYGNLGRRDIIWSDVATHKIAGFGAENPQLIANVLDAKKPETKRTIDNLFFTHPIRGGTSKQMVADNIFHALTEDTSANIKADAYNILSKTDFQSEREFIKQVKPTITFQDTTIMKLDGENPLESANFVTGILNQIQLIQEKLLIAKTSFEKNAVDKTLFTLETEKGFAIDINADALTGFPIWKGYLNRLYKANPEFFEGPISEMFLFRQLEQLNKFVNNVLVDIRKTHPGAGLFEVVKNPQLDTYRKMSQALNKTIDNFSAQLGVAREYGIATADRNELLKFGQTMFETNSYAETIQDMLMSKKGLSKVLSKDLQKLVKGISSIEVTGYTPIIRMSENGEEIGTERLERIIQVDKIDEYLENMPGQFVNKSEVHPGDFGLENMDIQFRATTRDGRIFEIETGPNNQSVKEVKLIGDTYAPTKEPLQDIDQIMDPVVAKEYTTEMNTFTC